MKNLLISIPKAGTHMLNQAVGIRGRSLINMPYGSMIYEDSPNKITLEMLQVYSGFGRTHIPYHPSYDRCLKDHDIKAVFLYRDPRDLMVSYYWWIKKLGHSGASIPGLIEDVTPILESEKPFDIMIKFWGGHIRRYIPWLYCSSTVLPIKYERLLLFRIETLEQIAYHWNYAYGTAEEMSRRIDPQRCVTFRKGIIGDYENYLTKEQQIEIADSFGDAIFRFGYTVL